MKKLLTYYMNKYIIEIEKQMNKLVYRIKLAIIVILLYNNLQLQNNNKGYTNK